MADTSKQEVELTPLAQVMATLRLVLLVVMVVALIYCVALFVAQYSVRLQIEMERRANPFESLLAKIRQMGISEVRGKDIAPLILAVVLVFARFFLDTLLSLFEGSRPSAGRGGAPAAKGARKPKETEKPVPMQAPPVLIGAESVTGDYTELLQRIASAKKKIEKATGEERKALDDAIRGYRDQLDAHKRDLAFLALDVVGSTSMKTSEVKVIVEHAFLAFRSWGDRILTDHGVWKSSWTPDGVMAAFPDLSKAVAAAQEILIQLPKFNHSGHEMGVPFQIRLGVSYGHVLFPDKARMDEVTDQVIDLAGHLQKYAQPDSLLVAKQDLERLRSTKGFRTSHRQVDGHDTFEWSAGG